MRTRLVLCAALAAAVTLIGCRIDQAVDIQWPAGTLVDTTSAGCPVGLIMVSSPASVNGVLSGPVGTTINFDGTVQVPTGCVAPDFDWTSSNTAVVTIDATGLATIAGVGSAEICMVLRADNTVRRCVTVTGTAVGGCTVTGVTITGTTNPIAVGSTLTLAATVASNPANCATQGVTWSSSNTAVATVSASGVVTGVSPGTVTITATSVNDPNRSGTFTVTVNATTTPTVTIGALTGMSTGNGCATTQPLLVTVSGVTNPVITVSSSNPGVATVAGSAGNWTVTRVAAGQVTFTASVTGSNLSSPITFTTPTLTVGTADCTTPGTVTLSNLVGMSTGTNCAATQPLVVTVNGVTNPVITVTSSNTAVATVSGSGANWVITRVGAGNVSFTASVTGSNQSQAINVTSPAIVVGTAPCAGAGTFTFSPASICFSRAQGAPTTATVAVTAADMPAGTVITVSSSNSALVSVSPSTFTYPTGTLTLTLAAGATTGNVNLTLSGNGATGSIPVQVQTAACPGSTTTIDYTPGGGTVTNNTPITLTAQCVQGTGVAACNPFWTSDHPELLTVRGNSTTTVNGQTFYVGTTATLQRIASGGGTTVQICVQWSLTQTSPRTCHGWVVP